MKAYREYDQAELDRQFNPELTEPDFLEMATSRDCSPVIRALAAR